MNSEPKKTNLMLTRINALRRKMIRLDLDAYLVLIEANRRYLSGYSGGDGQFDETAGALLITENHCLLATDSRYDLQARQEAPDFDIRCYRKSLYEALPPLFSELNVRRVGFESARLTVKHHQDLQDRIRKTALTVELVATENQVESLRLTKDSLEVGITRRAVACAENAFRQLCEWMRPGMTESMAARKLEDFMCQGGAEAASFPIIVAAGLNSAKPHAVPGHRPIGTGEPILLDWGARLDGYCSDISRTVIFGRPDDRFLETYKIVRDAQAAAIAEIRPGVHGRWIDSIARKIIEASGNGDKFGHSLGHGTGLCIHEAPRLSPHSEDTLASGMIVTVEPGVYCPDWGGIRLENQVLITEDGTDILNTLDLDSYRLD